MEIHGWLARLLIIYYHRRPTPGDERGGGGKKGRARNRRREVGILIEGDTMTYLERLLLLGFVLVGAAGCYAGMTLDQERTGKKLANKYHDVNVASLQSLAEKINKIDATKSDLSVIAQKLRELLNDKTQRTAETKEFSEDIPNGKLPKARVADFLRAINIVQNIGELKSNNRASLRVRLELIEDAMVKLLKECNWQNINQTLEGGVAFLRTFDDFPLPVPSQTTPKAMFRGVNAIGEAAKKFFDKLGSRAKVIKDETLLKNINTAADELVKEIDKTPSATGKRELNHFTRIDVDFGSYSCVQGLITDLKQLKGGNATPEAAILEKIKATLGSIVYAANWAAVSKAIEGKAVVYNKPKIIQEDALKKIVKSWNEFIERLKQGIGFKNQTH